jgi:hypothetical protein
MEEKPEIEEDKTRKATMEDVEALAKVIGVSTSGCSYNSFTITLVHFINNLMQHTLASRSVNLECLKILVGEPISTLQEIETLWKKHDELLKAEKKRKKYEEDQHNQTKVELRDLKRKVRGFLKTSMNDTIIATGIKDEMLLIAQGERDELLFANMLTEAAYQTRGLYQEFFSEESRR